MNGLTNKEIKQFSEIIFSLSERERREELEGMSDRQREKIKQVVAQKVIYEAVLFFILLRPKSTSLNPSPKSRSLP